MDEESDTRSANHGFRFTLAFFVVMLTATLATQFLGSGEEGWWGPRVVLGEAWPQSWTFFSTAPAVPLTVAFQVGETGELNLIAERQTTREGLWGLRRGSYTARAEMTGLMASLPEAGWVVCSPGEDCVEAIRAATPVVLVNTAPEPTMCGKVVLTRVRLGAVELDDPEAGLRDRLIRGVSLEIACRPR